ncbi:unnamed protein product [Discosporangium mesarthrocarpum]
MFSLLDRLWQWASSRGVQGRRSAGEVGKGWPEDRRRSLVKFVDRVPREVLVRGAMRVRAYTRALRYLDQHIRVQHAKRRLKGKRGTWTHGGVFRNDGANGTLPVLKPSELHQLQAIHRMLPDEPDGMVGLDVMRGASGVVATLKQRAWQHEHAEDWAGALEVYEQALQERELGFAMRSGGAACVTHPKLRSSGSGVAKGRGGNRDRDPMQARLAVVHVCGWQGSKVFFVSLLYDQMETAPLDAGGGGREGTRGGQRPSVERGVTREGVAGDADDEDRELDEDEWEEGEVERGMLHSLLELGHLEMLLHQASGMLNVMSKQHLSSLLLPVAVEASWRLQRWPLLKDLLQQCNTAGLDCGVFRPPQASGFGGSEVGEAAVALDELSGESRYQLALGQVMLCLHEGQAVAFKHALYKARADVMAGLGAASMESYRRAFPFLLRLHSLREVEQVFDINTMSDGHYQKGRTNRDQDRAQGSEEKLEALSALYWEGRLAAMPASLRQLAPVLAVRRAALELLGVEGLEAKNWLSLAKRARAAGQFAVSGAALRRAGRLGTCQARMEIEEAKLAHSREGVHRALLLLEPVETDVKDLRRLAQVDRARSHSEGRKGTSVHQRLTVAGGPFVEEEGNMIEDERLQIAKRLLLATYWTVEAGQKHGKVVVDRYKLALELRPGWEKGYFCLGQYMDLLFKSRIEELASRGGAASSTRGVVGRSSKRKGKNMEQGHQGYNLKGWETDEMAHRLAIETMENYAQSLKHGAKYIFQSMPRLLTLWFAIGFLSDPAEGGHRDVGGARSLRSANARAVASSRGKGGRHVSSALKTEVQKLKNLSSRLVSRAVHSIPPYMWYTALPQLTSRQGPNDLIFMCHPDEEIFNVIVDVLARVLQAHPSQAMWHLSSLPLSVNKTRRQAGAKIFQHTRQMLLKEGREHDATAIEDGKCLFEELKGLAEQPPPKDHRVTEETISIGRRMDLYRFIVPVQAALTVSLPRAPHKDTMHLNMDSKTRSTAGAGAAGAAGASAPSGPGQAEEAAVAGMVLHDPFPGGEVHIRSFYDRVQYMRSKAKPKKLSLKTVESGETVTFLCKRERDGDLRKDARLMEFNGMINRLLQRDPRGRARKLRLCTFSVICLSEDCGLLEWVQDTTGLRHLVVKAYQFSNIKSPSYPALKATMEEIQTQDSVHQMVYRERVLPILPPVFHRWFLLDFSEPTAWFEARTTFARQGSAAVWSSVGHVVGLGDRHGENILIHTESGECVHVDFDCLFDKGVTLQRPEIVPFRLTPNMVDGMGLCGYEGVFRRVMETCIGVLRGNREMLLSVLEPFLEDPTVGWGRSGRAQRADDLGGEGGVAHDDLHRESENEDAKRVLRVIKERLEGRYNLRLPPHAHRDKGSVKGGAEQGSDLPLSVQGQVHRLIMEATSQENLCQMYVGWMPWL